jgi:FkbM family methyltransferase
MSSALFPFSPSSSSLASSCPTPDAFLPWFLALLDSTTLDLTTITSLKEALHSRPVLLFGAGMLGQKVAQSLQAEGVSPEAFLVDEAYASQARAKFPNTTVLTPESAAEQYQDKHPVVLVCVCHDKHRFSETKARFEALGFSCVETFLRMASCFPDSSLFPYYQFVSPFSWRRERDTLPLRLQRIYAALADETSRQHFCQQLVFRVTFEHAVLPASPNYTPYFPEPVLQALPESEKVLFVDGGTFNGQSTLDAMSQLGPRFAGARCFEPDARNYERVMGRFQSDLPESLQDAVVCYRAAVSGQNGHMAFDCQGTEGSHLSTQGAQQVEVCTLDTALADVAEGSFALYIKLDLEGAEQDALKGAIGLLREKSPTLAVCAYHCPDDLWVLPEMILDAQPDYQLFYRIEGEDALGSVYYALQA